MTLIELRIYGFGKLNDLSLSFGPGINLIYGQNESGKSTLQGFLEAMLYGLDSSSGTDKRKKYEPWLDKSKFGGSLKIGFEGKEYTIKRSFRKDNELLSIYSNTDKRQLENPAEFLEKILNGVSETVFENSFCQGPLRISSGKNLVPELKKHILNLSGSGDSSVDYISALDFLEKKRKKLSEKLIPDSEKRYEGLKGELYSEELLLDDGKYENKSSDYMAEKEQIQKKIASLSKERDELYEKLSFQREELSSLNIRDIDELKNETEEADRLYKDFLDNSYNNSPMFSRIMIPVLPIIILISCIASFLMFLIYTGVLTHQVYSGAIMPSIIFFGIGLGSILLEIILLMEDNKRKKKEAIAEEKLKLLLIRHVANMRMSGNKSDGISKESLPSDEISTEVSKENLRRLKEAFKRSSSLLKGIHEGEKDISKLSDEISGLEISASQYDKLLQDQKSFSIELEEHVKRSQDLRIRLEKLKCGINDSKRLSEDIEALTLAIDSINELNREMRQSFGQKLNDRAGQLLKIMTNGAYDSIWIDDDLNIFLNTKDKFVSVNDISSGSMDQVYLSVRLSAAELLNGKYSEKLPLSFDDSFAMYDDRRLLSTLQFLSEAWNGQILIFSCQTREQRLLDASGLVFKNIPL